jgi:hypothetical protein
LIFKHPILLKKYFKINDNSIFIKILQKTSIY